METREEKIRLPTKEIAKRLREQLKEEFPNCKFSVVYDSYSGGSSITAALMVADRKVKQDFDKIPESAICRRVDDRYTLEQLKHLQEEDHHQLGRFYDDYDPKSWSNGVFLTYQGHQLLKRVEQISNEYNFDDSDSMTDYYHVNFSFSMQLGKWDKPFVDGVGFKVDSKLEANIKQGLEIIKAEAAKEEQENKLREIEAAQYRAEHKPSIPLTATHVIDGSGLRELTIEERETGQPLEKLEKRWFNSVKPTDFNKFTLEL